MVLHFRRALANRHWLNDCVITAFGPPSKLQLLQLSASLKQQMPRLWGGWKKQRPERKGHGFNAWFKVRQKPLQKRLGDSQWRALIGWKETLDTRGKLQKSADLWAEL